MRTLFAAGLLWLLGSVGAFAQASWQFEYFEGDEEGEISACTGFIEFSDAFFSVRLHGEEMDIFFFFNGFTLPFGEVLGSAILRVDGEAFVVSATTNDRPPDSVARTSKSMFLTPSRQDYGTLFAALKSGATLRAEFPNGDFYPIPLRGSSRALTAASNCWANRPTGPHSNNPFENAPTQNNPFEPA